MTDYGAPPGYYQPGTCAAGSTATGSYSPLPKSFSRPLTLRSESSHLSTSPHRNRRPHSNGNRLWQPSTTRLLRPRHLRRHNGNNHPHQRIRLHGPLRHRSPAHRLRLQHPLRPLPNRHPKLRRRLPDLHSRRRSPQQRPPNPRPDQRRHQRSPLRRGSQRTIDNNHDGRTHAVLGPGWRVGGQWTRVLRFDAAGCRLCQ